MLRNIFSSDLSKRLIRLALWGAGLASISAMIWTLGPLIEIGGYRPLQNYLIRDAVILIVMAAAATGAGLQFYRRRTSPRNSPRASAPPPRAESDAVVLGTR